MQTNTIRKHVIMNKQNLGGYLFSSLDAQVVTIGFFLCHDCYGDRMEWYRKWATDPHETETGGDASWLRKMEGRIELSWLLDEQGDGNVYLSCEEFLHMMDSWAKIYQEYPDRIRLTLEIKNEDTKVTLKALDAIAD